jgi:hypothetical protein
MYDAEDVLEFLNYHAQDLTHSHFFQIQKPSALEEAKEPEPEHKEGTVTVSKLTETLGLTEDCVRVFEDIDWNGL